MATTLPSGGIDIYYVDESTDRDFMVMSAIGIPFMRQVAGEWTVVWEDHFREAHQWRRWLSKEHGIPLAKELKGSKLLSGRGRYLRGKHQIQPSVAIQVYRQMLYYLDFLPERSIISVVGQPSSTLYGHGRLEAVLYALLQRMRTACAKTHRLGMVFFDEGHGEYRKLYRKARVFLPTGSNQGGWGDGKRSKSLPLANFIKDANVKESEHSFYTQLADIVSFACLLKIRGEQTKLTPWQAAVNAETLYDEIPAAALNDRASTTDPQGIVRLK